MFTTIALALVVLLFVGVIAIGLIVAWAFREEDNAPSGGSIFQAFRRWATGRPKRLTYRRDKKGRFRKVWRG